MTTSGEGSPPTTRCSTFLATDSLPKSAHQPGSSQTFQADTIAAHTLAAPFRSRLVSVQRCLAAELFPCAQVYGEDVAILAGDALLCRAFELVASTENVPAPAIVQVQTWFCS